MGKCVAEVVEVCASMYNFSASECLNVLLQKPMSKPKPKSAKSAKAPKSEKSVKSIPLPFMREHVNESGCQGITFNHGLFTQCRNERSDELMCSTCLETNCGTVEARLSADFKDPKGRKPTSYIAVLRKLKLTQEQAMEEAGKHQIELNDSHFVEQVKEVKVKAVKEPKVKVVKEKVIKEKVVKEVKEKAVKEKTVKEPKPVKEKVVKEPKVKEVKEVKEKVVKEKVGRPKSTKKAIETVTVEDLFASLVAEELSDNEDQQEVTTVPVAVEVVEVQVEVQSKEQKKAESAAERSEREQMKAAETEQKKYEAELKKATDKENKAAAAALLKEAKAAAAAELAAVAEAAKKDKEEKAAAAKKEKEEKAAAAATAKEEKAAALALAKQEKEAALALAKQEKEAALALAKKEKEEKAAAAALIKEAKAGKGKTVVTAVAEPVVVEAVATKVTVKRTVIEGKEYLKSSTNMIYDPETKDEVGIWNPKTETIDELPEESDDEEVEDEYESDSD